MTNSIEHRLLKLKSRRNLEIGIDVEARYTGTKKTRKMMLLDAYCKKQKGLCIICKCEMVKPVFQQNKDGFYTGACCGKIDCRAASETNEWFKS